MLAGWVEIQETSFTGLGKKSDNTKFSVYSPVTSLEGTVLMACKRICLPGFFTQKSFSVSLHTKNSRMLFKILQVVKHNWLT